MPRFVSSGLTNKRHDGKWKVWRVNHPVYTLDLTTVVKSMQIDKITRGFFFFLISYVFIPRQMILNHFYQFVNNEQKCLASMLINDVFMNQ